MDIRSKVRVQVETILFEADVYIEYYIFRTKGFRCDGVVGIDVGALLQEAIARRPQIDVTVSSGVTRG